VTLVIPPIRVIKNRWARAGRIGGWSNNRGGLPILRDSGKITEEEYLKRLAEHKAKSHPIADDDVFLAQIAQEFHKC
jgi:arylsulfatase A